MAGNGGKPWCEGPAAVVGVTYCVQGHEHVLYDVIDVKARAASRSDDATDQRRCLMQQTGVGRLVSALRRAHQIAKVCIRAVELQSVLHPRSFSPAIDGLKWLSEYGFDLAVAARQLGPEDESVLRDGFSRLFTRERIAINAFDSHRLVLFPEMDERAEVAEITEQCWTILNKSPATLMCASARMVIKRRGADVPAVVACTLLPYDPRFEMGHTLGEAMKPVQLNHPHCAKFCVLGGASCSA